MSCFIHEKPDYVINAAAFTHVDKRKQIREWHTG
jgi:dTDP-4-dehydrorhamnose reductase